MQKYTLPDSTPVSLSLCILYLSFPSVVWHTLARTVMPCCALWFSSFQVHPLLKPQISLSSLSLSACLYVDLCLALSFSAHNWKCLITKITLCLNTSKMSDKKSPKLNNDSNTLTFLSCFLPIEKYGNRFVYVEVKKKTRKGKKVRKIFHHSALKAHSNPN